MKGPNRILKHVLLVTMLLAFTVMLVGGGWIYKNQAPIPDKVVGPNGTVITTGEQIMGGQAVYQKYGLMDYGTVLGHGSYLGPDYTAEALQIMTVAMREHYAQELYGKPYGDLAEEQKAGAEVKTKSDLKANRFDEATKTLTLSEAQVKGFQAARDHYREYFTNGNLPASLPAGMIQEDHMPATDRAYVAEGDQLVQISDFFTWTAWLSAANRPGENYSYTNNWPYAPESGNVASYGSIFWSAISVTLLIAGLAVILWAQKKWHLEMEQAYDKFPRFDLSKLQVTEGQRKLGKYLLVVTLLFLVQATLGGYLAHYYAEGSSFYGIDLVSVLPFNIAKGWHLQLAVFWIATAWLAMGLYAAPAIAGEEPKGQSILIDVLFWALVVVVGGSLAGQWLGAKGKLGNMWWWLGHQGWEYLELGRVWQILLVAGLGIWLFILWRGLKGALKKETDKGGLTHLLLYTSIGIPLFYTFAFFIKPDSHITYADYWRWWIIHLWVEGMFEVFAVVIIGYLMVAMKLITAKSTVRALLFQLVILLGFLINLPIVSYFQHGSWLTPTHGHGALMGVYGMLAIALVLYVLRNIVKPEAYSEKLVTVSFWGLNIGLMGMILIVLMPIGFMQMFESFNYGFHVARDYAFYQKPLVNTLLWLRSAPDIVFLVPGIIPLVMLAFKGLLNLRPVQKAKGEAITVDFPAKEFAQAGD